MKEVEDKQNDEEEAAEEEECLRSREVNRREMTAAIFSAPKLFLLTQREEEDR